MKSVATIAVVVLLCVPAKAQFGGGQGRPQQPQAQNIELELLELEQDVDKTLLREALLLQGRTDMKAAPDTAPDNKEFERNAKALHEFIGKKKDAIVARTAEVRKTRAQGMRPIARDVRGDQQAKVDRQTSYEKFAEAQIDVQLLEAQLALLQEPLNAAVQALATAELAASNDGSQRAKAEAARKEFEKIKAKYVGYNKRLQAEQQGLQSMGMMSGMGGMGGGMR
jgi:hypothetical protein